VPQNDSQATLAPILKKEDALIDFNRTATEIHNRLRGFQPWPGAYTRFRDKNLKILHAKPSVKAGLGPAELHVDGERLYVGCGLATTLQLLQVQPEGKKAMSARDFIIGYKPGAQELL